LVGSRGLLCVVGWRAGEEGALCGRIAVSEGQWFLWVCEMMGCMWVGGGFMMGF